VQAKRRMEEVKVRLSDPNAARRAFRAVKKTVNAVGQEVRVRGRLYIRPSPLPVLSRK